jgi:hypothetical protein
MPILSLLPALKSLRCFAWQSVTPLNHALLRQAHQENVRKLMDQACGVPLVDEARSEKGRVQGLQGGSGSSWRYDVHQRRAGEKLKEAQTASKGARNAVCTMSKHFWPWFAAGEVYSDMSREEEAKLWVTAMRKRWPLPCR